MQTADCLNQIKPYLFVGINKRRDELKAQGAPIISLSIGDPDKPTPSHIVDAMIEALRDSANHHYPNYAGSLEFRAACATYLQNRFGLNLDPEKEILMLIGSKEGLAHIHTAYVNPGDYVLAPSIGYPVYSGGATLNNANVYFLPMNEENGWLADFSSVPQDVLDKASIMFLGYPNNPTGACAPVEYFDRAIEFCLEHDLLLCHDNAYCDICYDGYEAPSILTRPRAQECCLEFFSLSKGYNMTGWRIAFVAGNSDAIKALSTIKNNIDTGQFNATQKAGIVALTSSQDCVRDMCDLYSARRDKMVSALNEMGLPCHAPQASVYLWVKIPEGYTSASFCSRMMEEAYVVLTPGSGYGPDGEGYVRISLTTPDDQIDEALARMKTVLE